MSYGIIKVIDFCYGHRLLGHSGKCRFLHGHNGRLEIVLEGAGLDGLGMVRDFGTVKEIIGGWVDRELDHRMILRRDDPVVEVLEAAGEPLTLIDANPTAENLARLVFDYAVSAELPVREVRLWETPTSIAIYRGE